MSNEIKNEFKDFITTLSTEICKEVLLEELKKVNTSLNSKSKEYDELYDKYKFSIEEIKQELSKLDNANKSMSNFTNSINENSKIVNESLKIIKIGQEKSLEKYKADIHKLNATERNEFINSLNTNLSEYSKKYKDELSTIINGSKMNQTLENTEDINKSLKSVNMQINLVKSNIDKLAKDTILKNEEQSNKI